jgi:hypothetical protein
LFKELKMEQATITLTDNWLRNLEGFKNSLSAVTRIQVEARTAQRRVTGWVVDNVGNMLRGDTPQLILLENRTFWRVPILLGSTHKGMLGKVGEIDVNAETGELSLTAHLRDEILTHAQALARSASDAN